MRNLKVLISYKGTAYHGFQCQKNAVTIQEVIENTLSKIVNTCVNIQGCSRTDTGVHALMYCFSFYTESNIPCRNLTRALNGMLPDDICAVSCEDVPGSFHARFSCKAKEYLYKINVSPVKNPFAPDLSLHYKRELDTDLLWHEAQYFVGTHDFTSVSGTDKNKQEKYGEYSRIRTIEHIHIDELADFVNIHIKGDGFLYNMVRIIVGTLLWVNEGKIARDSIPQILEEKDRRLAGKTARPHGLYLENLWY